MANPFVHLELNTPDLAKAKAFYGALFGWQFQDNGHGAHRHLQYLQTRRRSRAAA